MAWGDNAAEVIHAVDRPGEEGACFAGSRDLSIRLDLVEAQSKKRWGNRGNTEKQPRIRERLSNTNVRAPESGYVAGET